MKEDEIVAGIAYHIDKWCTGGDENDWPCAEAIKAEFVEPLRQAALNFLAHPGSAKAALRLHDALGTNPLTYQHEIAGGGC